MATASNIRSNVYQNRKNGSRKLSNGNVLVKHRATTTKLPLLSAVSGVSERQGTATARHFSTGSTEISREDSISKWILDREHLVNATRKFLPVLTERGGFVYAEAWAFNEEKLASEYTTLSTMTALQRLLISRKQHEQSLWNPVAGPSGVCLRRKKENYSKI